MLKYFVLSVFFLGSMVSALETCSVDVTGRTTNAWKVCFDGSKRSTEDLPLYLGGLYSSEIHARALYIMISKGYHSLGGDKEYLFFQKE